MNQARTYQACHQRDRRWHCLFAFMWFLVMTGAASAQPSAREYDVKATLLFNFSQFVEWPEASLGDADAPFVIGILGTDPFGKFLDDLVKGEKAHGRPIQVIRYRRAEEAVNAHILFISKSEQSRMAAILGVLKNRPVLTVGDAGEVEFAEKGGMVAFIREQGNVRLAVNLHVTRLADLKVSAKLLKLAKIVGKEQQ